MYPRDNIVIGVVVNQKKIFFFNEQKHTKTCGVVVAVIGRRFQFLVLISRTTTTNSYISRVIILGLNRNLTSCFNLRKIETETEKHTKLTCTKQDLPNEFIIFRCME